MKKYLLSFAFVFLFIGTVYAADRVSVQVQFRKALWQCPQGDEITDLNADGTPSVYTHTCKGGMWLNSFKEYNGVLRYTTDEYSKVETADINIEKTKRVDDWIYEIKNPAPYIEPKSFEVQAQIDSKLQEIQQLETQKTEILAKESIKVINEK